MAVCAEALQQGMVSFRQYDLRMYEPDGCGRVFVPAGQGGRFWFAGAGASLAWADSEKHVLSEVPARSLTCRAEGSDTPVAYRCWELPDGAAYVVLCPAEGETPFLRSSDTDRFPPLFCMEGGRACEAVFLAGKLWTPQVQTQLGVFLENAVMSMQTGAMIPCTGVYTSGPCVLKAGTVLDVSNTALTLGLRGFDAAGLVCLEGRTRIELPHDFLGTVSYRVGSWKWPDDAPNLAERDLSYFIRVITPEERASNPWRGKVWYSYGTSISDIGQGDEIGNNGHSGKWPLYFDAVSDMKRCNGAIGSGGIRDDAKHGGNVKKNLLQTPYDCDLVTLEVIPNDDAAEMAHVGTIEDTAGTTICGAFRQCCEYITRRTRAKFVVLFLGCATTDRLNQYAPIQPMQPRALAYRETVRRLTQIAECYGVPVIDAQKEAANWWHNHRGILMRDQIHLNYLGGEVFGRYLWKKIRAMDPYPRFPDITEE